MPRIDFQQHEDGTVSYNLIIEEGDCPSDNACLAAYSMAKRGLTHSDAIKYQMHAHFGFLNE